MADKVTKVINLKDYPGWEDLSREEQSTAKRLIGDFVTLGILEQVGAGRSPVQSGPWQKRLSKDYRKQKIAQGGAGYADMELSGNMLSALRYRNRTDGLEIGIWKKSETPKAENHNFGVTLPQRQFIPEEGQKFKRNIEKGIKDIIKELYEENQEEEDL
jgi:hypothetical protein